MDIISVLLHSVPVVVGIALVAIALGGGIRQSDNHVIGVGRIPLITGIVLIVLGLLIK